MKILIFDMDGVLFDTGRNAFEHVRRAHPEMTWQDYQEISAVNFHEGMEVYRAKHPPIVFTEEEHRARKEAYSELKKKSPLFPGIRELLEGLHADGYTIILNTSAADHNCIPLLEHTGIDSLFDLVASANMHRSKTEKFRMILEQYGATTDDVLFVTDTLGDIREAHEADIPTVGITWGLHDEAFLTREHFKNLIKIVHSPEELKSFIDKHFSSQ